MKAYIKKQALPEWYLAHAKSMAYNYPDYNQLEKQAELYKRLSWVGTAIDVVSIIAATTKISVKRENGEDLEDIPNHDFEKKLKQPNPLQSGLSFIRSVTANYRLYRNTYIWLNIVNGSLIEMWNIPSSHIAPISDGRMGVKAYKYNTGSGTMEIPTEQVVHIGDFDPTNMIEADSSLSSITMTANADLSMQRWNSNVYKGNGRLPGVMTFADMIQDPTWGEIEKAIDNKASKNDILLLRGTGTGAVNWISTSTPPKDMDFYLGREHNRDEIWSRLAPGLTSMLSESATEANSRTGKAVLIDLVVYPTMLTLCAALTQKVLKPYYGEDLVVEPDDIRVTDRTLRLQEIAEYGKTHTLDETRAYAWQDGEIGDERGLLLVAEAQTAKITAQQEQPSATVPPQESSPQVDTASQQNTKNTKTDYDPRPAILEMEKWERKAIKSIGKPFEFECYNIPVKIADGIKADLAKCANIAAVKGVFYEARALLANNEQTEPSALAVLSAIKMGVEALKVTNVKPN